MKNYAKALEWFKNAIGVKMNWPDAHYGLALCCLKIPDMKEDAVEHIENAVKYSIEEYNKLCEKRRIRDLERIK